MIDFGEALKLVSDNCRRLPLVRIPVPKSLGYTLAESIRANTPLPRFDASAVDGFAVRSSDLANASRRNEACLQLTDTLAAGDTRIVNLKKGTTIRILTGAQIPAGADTVIMQEHVRVENDLVYFSTRADTGGNIRFAGDEFKKGEVVLESGTLITPPVVALLATLGRKHVRVRRKPRVALIVTGNELQPPGTRLRRGNIHDSNTPGLLAAMRAMGIDSVRTFRTRDNPQQIEQAFKQGVADADIVVSSGGVSVGSSDFVKEVLADLHVRSIFWRIAIKPGKPIFFGKKKSTLIFGLPGNPVAALLGFQLLIKPALLQMMGMNDAGMFVLSARLSHDLKKKRGRMEFVRGTLSHDSKGTLHVAPTRGQDSHMVGGLANADCLIHFPKECKQLSAGDAVKISLLKWGVQ
ncbi:MAG: molybdopterin molybdotransferase MoeA [Bacteroidetes bacterium]|nr:molybdopterin molybdotransferase MoeA [Bacteroidota bacterium]MCW5894981.1 molybdopterin molybdotransferase MoeA [Bacteroidota bacterium]